MFVIENCKGIRKARPLEMTKISNETKKITVLGKDGKKIMKNVDRKTYELKFG